MGKKMQPPKIETATEIFDRYLQDKQLFENHVEVHEKLVGKETKNGWDCRAKSESEVEKQAAKIIRKIREIEQKYVFGNTASEALPRTGTLDMGGQFLTNKERIDNESKLYEIARQVPKGALLHLHFNAELGPERLLVQARTTKNMYIRSTQPLRTEEDLRQTEMVFEVLDPNKVERGVTIFSKEYPGDAKNWRQEELKWKVWMPWMQFQKDFVKNFPEGETQDYSGPSNVRLYRAEKWLMSKMVLSEEEVYRPSQTVNG
jgi:adenosine deaminase CECR1